VQATVASGVSPFIFRLRGSANASAISSLTFLGPLDAASSSMATALALRVSFVLGDLILLVGGRGVRPVSVTSSLVPAQNESARTGPSMESEHVFYDGRVSFTERNLPPRTPAGPKISDGVRTSILATLMEGGVSPTSLWTALQRRQGYRHAEETREDIDERFSSAQAIEFEEAMKVAIEAVRRRRSKMPRVDYLAEPALLAVPEGLFLDAVELGLAVIGPYPGGNPHVREINALFERRGIYFRFNEWGHALWVGDPGTYAEVVAPALDVLGDARLAVARQEFEDALGALRRGGRIGEKNAIRDASNAVETSMKALLDAHGLPRSGTEAADALWDALYAGGVVAEKTKEQVCGPCHIGNRYGRHGPDPNAGDPPPAGVAALAVQAAAAAITYLASLLP
jgi:hypothetical protein